MTFDRAATTHRLAGAHLEQSVTLTSGDRHAVSEFGATTKCGECTIFIGPGHVDEGPLPDPDRTGALCRACATSRARRRKAEAVAGSTPADSAAARSRGPATPVEVPAPPRREREV